MTFSFPRLTIYMRLTSTLHAHCTPFLGKVVLEGIRSVICVSGSGLAMVSCWWSLLSVATERSTIAFVKVTRILLSLTAMVFLCSTKTKPMQRLKRVCTHFSLCRAGWRGASHNAWAINIELWAGQFLSQ